MLTPDSNGNSVQIGAGAYTSPKAGAWFAGPGYQFMTPPSLVPTLPNDH